MNNHNQHIKSNEFQELIEFVQKWIDYKSNGIKDVSDNYILPNQLLLSSGNESKINSFRSEIKKKLVRDFEGSIELLKQSIDCNNRIFDDLLLLERKYFRINSQSNLGTLDFDRAELEYTKMDSTLLFILNNLTEEDLANKKEKY